MKIRMDSNSPVQVERFQPNREDPAQAMRVRIIELAPLFPHCVYFSPLATVSCDVPTPEFFRTARKIQAQWCQRCKTTYGRRARRSVKDWVNSDGVPNRQDRYVDRALCFIGLLFLEGKHVPPHQWPDRKPMRRNPIKPRKRSEHGIPTASANDSLPEEIGKKINNVI